VSLAESSAFDGFRLLERPQSPRRRIEADLSSQRRHAAKSALDPFDTSHWVEKYPIAQSWRRNWERVIPFFAFPEAFRRI
jgi:transposase-like protein